MKTILGLLLVTYVTAAPTYDCSFGESYWCSNLNIAKRCGAFQHCMDTVWRHTDLSNMQDADSCLVCQVVMRELDQLILEKSSEAQVEQFFNQACELVPEKEFADLCKQQADANIQEVFEMARESLDPKSVCSAIGLCPGFRDLVQHRRINNDLHFVPLEKSVEKEPTKTNGDVCKDCKAFIGDFQDMIESNATEKEIINFLQTEVCTVLGLWKGSCDELVNAYTPEIVDMIAASVDPDQICQAFRVCPGDHFILQKMKLKKAQIARIENLQGGELCPICEMAFQELKTMLSEQTVQQDVENFIKKNLCANLGSYQQTCETDVDQYGAILFEMVTSELDATTICTTLGLCGQRKKVLKVAQGVECVICEFVIKQLDSVLEDNSTQEEIIEALDEVCSQLPDTISQQCKSFVDTYGKAVVALLEQSLDPQEVCTSLGLCTSTKIPMKKPGVSAGPSELCVVCETAIQYLDSLLEEKDTKAKIEAAIDKVCNFLPENMQQECNDFVMQYGPMLIQLVLEAANPQKVCSGLKLCTSVKLPVIEPVITPQKGQLVGENECTYGPAYWCQNYENAKKCKATIHCRKYVWKNRTPKF